MKIRCLLILSALLLLLAEHASAYYNPTVGRWLSKDPIGERGGLNLTGFVENDPVNGYDPLGLTARLSYRTIYGPKAGYCGNFGWKIEWNATGDLNRGTISQEISIKYNIRDKNRKKIANHPRDQHFWEYWSVPGANNNNVDPWINLNVQRECTSGTVKWVGKAEYVDGDGPSNTNPIPPGNTPGPPFYDPGEDPPTHTSPKKPKFPKGAQRSKTVTRKVTLKWDCCKNPASLTEFSVD